MPLHPLWAEIVNSPPIQYIVSSLLSYRVNEHLLPRNLCSLYFIVSVSLLDDVRYPLKPFYFGLQYFVGHVNVLFLHETECWYPKTLLYLLSLYLHLESSMLLFSFTDSSNLSFYYRCNALLHLLICKRRHSYLPHRRGLGHLFLFFFKTYFHRNYRNH